MSKISKQNHYKSNSSSENLNEDSEELNLITTINRTTFTNFDLVPKLIESSSLIENQSFTPKLLKMFDSIQNSYDTQNQILNENLPQFKESVIIDLARKSSDLTHRQQLQSLLINALNDNDLIKANLINSFLSPNQNNSSSSQLLNSNYNQQPNLNNFIDLFSQVQNTNRNSSNQSKEQNSNFVNNPEQINETSQSNHDMTNGDINESQMQDEEDLNETNNNINNNNNTINNTNSTINNTTQNQSQTNSDSNNEDSQNNDDIIGSEDTILYDKKIKPKLRAGPLSPIRHLICSPGLEATAHKYKIIVLYRGACNGYCYANKPWSKQVHLHYIVNTVNCNDHISRLVKKQGIQFYNSFVLQSPERWNQLIQLYRMEKVKQLNQLNQTM